jgi:GTPase subunit of restriction endonuclease
VGDGKLGLLDGPFLGALAKASEPPDTPYVLVIEEINRGNPAQIFGELLTLLEADKRTPEAALRLCYLCYQKNGECRTMHLPANLYLIGTMNIADRSLAIVDFALRRRFAFFDLVPHFGEDWQTWMRERAGLPADFLAALADAMLDNVVTRLSKFCFCGILPLVFIYPQAR